MADPLRTVWILGAGFSVPLGGGMLGDLLSLKQRAAVQIRFPGLAQDYPQEEEAVYTLYHAGAGYPEGHLTDPWLAMNHRAKLWSNAEDFIDYLDATARAGDGPQRKRLEQVWASHWSGEFHAGRYTHSPAADQPKFSLPPTPALRDYARRAIAAECLLFTDDGVQETERWSPYRRWACMLNNSDVVITFNYDLVIERLTKVEGSRVGQRSVVVTADDYDFQAAAKLATVLKVHGSVNWQQTKAGTLLRAADDEALTCPASNLALATPGPTKPQMVGSAFKLLWARTWTAIEAADAVVFIGYRFPPTDAGSREWLLDALRANKRPHLDVHIVLGPERSKDVVRLERLIEYSLDAKDRTKYEPESPGQNGFSRSYSVHWEPLWAEDYLSVLNRESLHVPPPKDWNVAPSFGSFPRKS